MDSTILNVEDWMKFCHTHFEDICNFINKGNVNNDFKEVFEFWKRDSDTKHLCYWKIPEMHRISKTEVYNAIEEFVHIVHIKAMHKTINPILNGLIKRDVSTSSVSSAYDKSETLIRNIMEKYFNINIHTIQKDTGDYHKCELKLLELYKNYFGIDKSKSISLPIWVARECRNKIHPVDKKDKHEITEIKGYHQARELAMFLIWTCIEIIALCRKILQLPYEKKDFHPGETIYLKILNEKCSSVEWSIENNGISRANGTLHKDNLAIPDVFKYEDIKIKVITENAKSIDFNISLDGSHYGRKTIVLDCLHNTFECDSSAMKETVKDNCTNLSITSDLECELESSEIAQTAQIRPGEITQMLIPKGKQTITLTANKNPKYRISREIDIDNDTVINDMLFSREVRKHREWWNVKDIVVLKRTIDKRHEFVLWDKSVDLPVYFCKCHDDKCFDDCETGFTGNFFYVKEDSNGYYRYYDLSSPGNDRIVSENLFTFNQGYEFTGCRGIGDALVIGENGALFLTIFKSLILNSDGLYDSIEWPDALKEHYDKFIRQFQFSEGWAAILKPEGVIRFVNKDWIEDSKYSYSYDYAVYPLFHNGYCAVKKGDIHLFIEDRGGFLEEMDEEYEYLQKVEAKGNCAYIVKTKTGYGIMDPAKRTKGRFLLHPVCQSIEAAYGLFNVTLNGKSGILDSHLNDFAELTNDKIRLLSDAFYIAESINKYGVLIQYLCTKYYCIAAVFKGYELVYDCNKSANFIAIHCYNGKWKICDTAGNDRVKDYDDFKYYGSGIFLLQKANAYEYWIAKGNDLHKMTNAVDYLLVEQSEIFFYNIETIKRNNDEEVVTLQLNRIDSITGNVHPISKRITCRLKDYDNPFLANYAAAKQINGIDLKAMEQTLNKYSEYYVILNLVGNLWISSRNTVYSSKEGILLTDECREVIPLSEDLYYINYKNSLTSHIMTSSGTRFHFENYREIRPIVYGFAAVKKSRWGFINISGTGTVKTTCILEYSAVRDFTKEGYAMVQKDSGWGLIDAEGNLVVECRYDYVDPFICNVTSVRKGNQWSIISRTGEEVIIQQ